MTKPKIFIDGEHGTTGLQILDRLKGRTDIDLITMPFAERHSKDKRGEFLRAADIAILCLPDDAAKESVVLAEGAGTRFIDASSAHRTADGWAYGFAEMAKGQADVIRTAQWVANPGCYPTGAIGLIRPLTEAGLLPADYPLTINAVSGYSGGGKQLIAQMEDQSRNDAISANIFAYGLTLKHKHVPEITKHGGLTRRPIFTPSVARYMQGMLVNVPLHLDLMAQGTTMERIHEALTAHYAGQDIVQVAPIDAASTLPRIDPEGLNGTDMMRLHVLGTSGDGTVNLIAQLDNLGKGASGAAVQNLNLMIGG